MKNRKGITGFWINLIIVSIVAVSLFFFVGKLQAATHKVTRDKGCYALATYITATSFEYGPFAYENKLEEDCPRFNVNFGEEEGQILKDEELYETISYKRLPNKNLNSEKVHKIIADEMISCWNKFGAGKMDTFFVPANWWQHFRASEYEKEAIGCYECGEITFELGSYEEFTGFKDFLMNNKKTAYSGTYYEELTEQGLHCDDIYLNSRFDNCWEGFANLEGIPTDPLIKTDEIYQIVFVRKNPDKEEGTMNTYIMSLDTKKRVCQKTLPFK